MKQSSYGITQLLAEFVELKNKILKKRNTYKRLETDKEKEKDAENTTGIPGTWEKKVIELEKIGMFLKIKIEMPRASKEFWENERTTINIVVREIQ